MELYEYLRVVGKHWKAVVVVTLLSTFVAWGAAMLATPEYRTHASVFFSVADGSSYNEIAQGSAYSQRQVVSFAELATSTIVLEPVLRELKITKGVGDLKKQLSVTIPTDTSIVNISATDPSPERSADMANTVAKELKTASYRLAPKHSNGDAMVQATVTTPAVVPEAPVSPRPRINLVIGFGVGLGLAIAFAVLREAMDNRVRTEEDIRQLAGAPVLGQIPYEKHAASGPRPLVGSLSASPQSAEAFNKLRLNLQFIEFVQNSRVITVVSAMPTEGKTTTAVDLAISMAQSGSRVLLIDGDLRRPAVARTLGLEGSVGLTSTLIGQIDIEDVLQSWGDGGLDVLTAGVLPPNPVDLLNSAEMKATINKLRAKYDSIIIDAPPLLPVTDGHILNSYSDGALLVVAAGATTKNQFIQASQNLEKFDSRVLGVVLNKVQPQTLQDSLYSYKQPIDSPSSRVTSGRKARIPERSPRRFRKRRNTQASKYDEHSTDFENVR
ncbi:polysaccharide biosynthesis tyrosine autokinase [Arthrobacter rhombi]|uniref:polysaccharide biosynthesis tyrosine autokinase n=1 Tax=Arthrobacter rhombi TaxID=71253 RepID=UPI003FD1C427